MSIKIKTCGSRLLALLLPALVFSGAFSEARAEDPTAYAVTIYSSTRPGGIPAELYRPGAGGEPSAYDVPGYATVREQREIGLEAGTNEIRITDVAAYIDPTTVTFSSLTDPVGTQVLEQDYRFDLVSNQRLLERYLGQEITVEQIHGDGIERVSGKLLGASDGLILQDREGTVRTLSHYDNIQFSSLPGGLITRPTLIWRVAADKAGRHKTRLSYETAGMTWWADYNVQYREPEPGRCLLDLNAWVTLVNRYGAGYPDSRLKLIAGDVQRVETRAPQPRTSDRVAMMAKAEAGFEEKSFFEYHLYTLPHRVDLVDRSTKQLELFPKAASIPCRKELVFEASPSQGYGGGPVTGRYGESGTVNADVFLRFRNDEKSGLGRPLPAGRIRVNQLDPADDTLEFIGEAAIDHTPRDEQVLVRLGEAFDVVGERQVTTFTADEKAREMSETIRIEIRNHKKEATDVVVRERLWRWRAWEITEASRDYEKVDAATIHFPVKVPARGQATVTYTAHYTW